MKQPYAAARKYWIAVASRDHVYRWVQEEFAQVSHGKVSPLSSMQPGDMIIYYSPTREYGIQKPYQMFTALGMIQDGAIACGVQSPWPRLTRYEKVVEISAKELVPLLACIPDKR